MKSEKPSEPLARQGVPRRSFLKKSLAAGVATAVLFPFVNLRYGLAAPEPIRVGVVGCGGRGTGAALNVLQAKTKVIYPPPRKGCHTENAVPGAKAVAENVEVIALADLFRDRLEECRAQLRAVGTSVLDENCFDGFDGCEKLLQVPGLNYVILAPPRFSGHPSFEPPSRRASTFLWRNPPPSTLRAYVPSWSRGRWPSGKTWGLLRGRCRSSTTSSPSSMGSDLAK